MKIVVADDLLEMRQYLHRLLVNWGHDVLLTAANGLELIEAVVAHRPELIVTDIDMPEMDGDEAVLRIWKQHPTPVLMISAFELPEHLVSHPHRAQLRHLYKPVIQGDLRAALEAFESESRCSF